MMSRQDYRIIAAAIAEEYKQAQTASERNTLVLLVHTLSNCLKADNSRFDRDKFYAAALPKRLPTPLSQATTTAIEANWATEGS